MKPILVTGGCGFVGRHLVKRLLADGRQVWIVDDLSVGKHPKEWLKNWAGITFIKKDAIIWFYDMVRGAQTDTVPCFSDIYHLASIVGGRELIDGDPILVGTDLGIDAIFFLWATRFRNKFDRILYASSSAAYPTSLQAKGNTFKLQEDMIQFNGGDLGQPDMTYGWGKLTGEYLANLAAQKYGLHIACVRPFSGYGEDQDLTYPIPAIAARVARHEDPLTVWGTGEQARDFVYIEDCIDAMLLAIEHISNAGAVNIGSGELTSMNQICRKLADLEGYYPRIQPLIDKPVGVQNRFADPRKIGALGWVMKTPLQDGLSKVLEWQKRAG